ncbi:uncharacterized protein [Periplaneta americana]|uniref:uncharacterized protein isoform X4 n=1 Tax=Periplaneta americana TaxID=6978 RepID=UPI0037E704EB
MVTMDVIKAELEVDPLALETNHGIDENEKKHILEGVQISSQIKIECEDNSCDFTSEMKHEAKEELCDFDAIKEELKLEVTAEENENLTNSFADTHYSTVSSDCEGFAQAETIKHSVPFANILRAHRANFKRKKPDGNGNGSDEDEVIPVCQLRLHQRQSLLLRMKRTQTQLLDDMGRHRSWRFNG